MNANLQIPRFGRLAACVLLLWALGPVAVFSQDRGQEQSPGQEQSQGQDQGQEQSHDQGQEQSHDQGQEQGQDQGQGQERGSDEAVREGRALYDSHQCWQCHGYEGQGSVAGVRIAPTLYPLEAFSRLVRHTNIMPAYSPNVLSDEQLELIYAFVLSIPEPPPLEEIPELDFE